jgi:hypothetical protein
VNGRRMTGERTRRADWYWRAQLLVALLVFALIGASVALRGQSLAARVLTWCQGAARGLSVGNGGLAVILPPTLAAASLLAAVFSLSRQYWITQNLLRVLGPPQPLPANLRTVALRLGLERRIYVIANPRPWAFCAGLFRPKVWLSTGLLRLLDGAELEAVLRHERHHLRHRDPLKLMLVRAAADALFYLPLARELARAYEIDKELGADAEVTGSSAGQVGLAGAMLKLLSTERGAIEGAAIGSLLLDRRAGVMGLRLDQLTGIRVPPLRLRRRSLLFSSLALLLFMAVVWLPVGAAPATPAGESCGPQEAPPIVIPLERLSQ